LPVGSQKEFDGVQGELEKEISSAHPLWGCDPKVFGRHQACDDILVALNEGRFAIVHLIWHGKVDQYPDRFPSTQIIDDIEEVQKTIDDDADDWK
jgi:hypothetical protein